MHRSPGFVLPNAWDAGSARILEQVGFAAVATTSAGIAWAAGSRTAGRSSRDTMLDHVGRIVAAVDVPVTADLEAGYGDVAATVRRSAVEVGAVGGNLEDQVGGALFGIEEAADRIAAARAAAPVGSFVINARTDTYFGGATGDVFAETIERATRYVEAGADCVFVPALTTRTPSGGSPSRSPRPLNLVAGLSNTIPAPTLFSLGVRRISLGGSIARAALSLRRAGRPRAAGHRHARVPRGRHRLCRPAGPVPPVIAVLGGHGKTGRAVCAALADRGLEARPLGRADWSTLAAAVAGCQAAYVIAPNLHPDEPAYVGEALAALTAAGVPRVVYHSVASPYVPEMPHHLGKAVSEDLVRRSGLAWTILQPGAYLQNLDLSGPVAVPYDVDAVFGFADLRDVAEVAAVVLLEDGHVGATYELASRSATVAQLAAEAGFSATRTDERPQGWLGAMFAYYDRHGLPVGTRVELWPACLGR